MAARTEQHSRGQRQTIIAGPEVLIVTGLSGSGKTVALRAVEDVSYFCVDNLPVGLIHELIKGLSERSGIGKVAIGIDIREQAFLADFRTVLAALRRDHAVEVLFLEARTETLVRRFKETRRPHPLGGSLEEAIRRERNALGTLRKTADRVIDTSPLSPHQLRRLITTLFAPSRKGQEMAINILSFGFKHGAPQNIDLLFDVRFLPNPYFIPELKDLNGTDSRVARYVMRQPDTRQFIEKVSDLLRFLLPRYLAEGKTYLSIAFGCTGGNHRSPAIVEAISRLLRKNRFDINVIHRDLS